MPRRVPVDLAALAVLLAPGRSVATHRQLREAGVPASTITRRIRREGPWQRVLPGVVAGHRGVLTRTERRLAAIQYAGRGGALTGRDALEVHGVRVRLDRPDDRVHVLVPHPCQRSSHGFALVTRSRRPLDAVLVRGLACVPVARAVIDAARRTEDLADVRELVAAAVQQRRCTVAQLAEEVRLAARQRSALSREALAEVAAGVRSGAEARLREVFAAGGVPAPRWNVPIRSADGEVIAVADAYWHELRAVVELDSVEWHASPAAYRSTQRRQRALVAHGERVLALAPRDVHDDPAGVCREVMASLRVCVEARRAR
ncbi:hypothetical protein [Quadrisphaera sp. DSM 44207]|uniref:hypothetical protein n=1 Tax=Quadrisphaera sp. DSM 44207 TaxID=1881057 RepID=UPI0008886157|nr:hypothetical protein [Quadrisphaera sp. DSM 44207]SDQ04597.1 hypothetical protein SAMN05428996_0155 [Quadrisphaera sp. DSM 44207]